LWSSVGWWVAGNVVVNPFDHPAVNAVDGRFRVYYFPAFHFHLNHRSDRGD
jgi:hypothetical protein